MGLIEKNMEINLRKIKGPQLIILNLILTATSLKISLERQKLFHPQPCSPHILYHDKDAIIQTYTENMEMLFRFWGEHEVVLNVFISKSKKKCY